MENEILDDLKLLKGIDDELQDNLLKLIIKQSYKAVLSRINTLRKEKLKKVPSDLDWVVLEVSTNRFNRLNSEGMKSKTEEGSRLEWEGLLDEYETYFDEYADDPEGKSKKGVLRIW